MKTFRQNFRGWLLIVMIPLLLGIATTGLTNQTQIFADSTQAPSSEIDYKTLNPAWVSADYAAKIPDNVTGTDPTTHNAYIDEWMPDPNFQKIVLKNLNDPNSNADFKSQNVTNVQDITKAKVAKLAKLYGAPSYEASEYYQIQMDTKSVEGLQYAKDLTTFELGNELNANINNGKPPFTWSTLTDISALASLSKLYDVNVQFTNVSNIASLANKPELVQLSMSYDHITDISPLKSDTKLPAMSEVGYQYVKGSTIRVNPTLQNSVTTDDTVKDLNGQPITLKPYRGSSAGDLAFTDFYQNFISTANGTNLSATQNKWQDLQGNNGYLTTWWENPFLGNSSYTFFGVIIHPYVVDTNLSAPITVHYQDDQNHALKDDSTSTGKIDAAYTAPTPEQTITVNNTVYHYVGVKKGESVPKTYSDKPQSFTYVYAKSSTTTDLNYTAET